jgi:hypothetical protein
MRQRIKRIDKYSKTRMETQGIEYTPRRQAAYLEGLSRSWTVSRVADPDVSLDQVALNLLILGLLFKSKFTRKGK